MGRTQFPRAGTGRIRFRSARKGHEAAQVHCKSTHLKVGDLAGRGDHGLHVVIGGVTGDTTEVDDLSVTESESAVRERRRDAKSTWAPGEVDHTQRL